MKEFTVKALRWFAVFWIAVCLANESYGCYAIWNERGFVEMLNAYRSAHGLFNPLMTIVYVIVYAPAFWALREASRIKYAGGDMSSGDLAFRLALAPLSAACVVAFVFSIVWLVQGQTSQSSLGDPPRIAESTPEFAPYFTGDFYQSLGERSGFHYYLMRFEDDSFVDKFDGRCGMAVVSVKEEFLFVLYDRASGTFAWMDGAAAAAQDGLRTTDLAFQAVDDDSILSRAQVRASRPDGFREDFRQGARGTWIRVGSSDAEDGAVQEFFVTHEIFEDVGPSLEGFVLAVITEEWFRAELDPAGDELAVQRQSALGIPVGARETLEIKQSPIGPDLQGLCVGASSSVP